MSRDSATLLDMLTAARLVIAFRGTSDKTEFLDDLKTQSAVLHQLLILGEAVKRLSEAFRVLHPELPWKQIAGMRDHLIHGYDSVDLDEVWITITSDIPSLLASLETLASSNDAEETRYSS